MTKRVSRLQTGVGLALLAVGLGLYGLHLWHAGPFDWRAKVALGIAGAGLLLLPFEAGPLFNAALRWKRASGGDGKVSGGKSE